MLFMERCHAWPGYSISQLGLGLSDNKGTSRSMVEVWRSGNGVGRINDVALCQARLVLGWVTVFGM